MTIISDMRPENQTRVLLADYPGPGRSAIAALVDGLGGATLVASVEDPPQILPVVDEVKPDVVIVDDRLLRDARSLPEGLATRLIVMGMDDDPAYRRRAKRLGAEAWVAKECADVVLPVLLPNRAAVTERG